MGVTNTAGTIGSVRLGDSGELRSGNNLRRCNFFFTKDSVESNTRCYYNSLDGVFVPELSGTQCTTSPAPRTKYVSHEQTCCTRNSFDISFVSCSFQLRHEAKGDFPPAADPVRRLA